MKNILLTFSFVFCLMANGATTVIGNLAVNGSKVTTSTQGDTTTITFQIPNRTHTIVLRDGKIISQNETSQPKMSDFAPEVNNPELANAIRSVAGNMPKYGEFAQNLLSKNLPMPQNMEAIPVWAGIYYSLPRLSDGKADAASVAYALSALLVGDWRSAETVAKKILQETPKDFSANLILGFCSPQKANWFIHLQKAFEIAPQKTVFVTMWLLRHARERLLQNRNWDFWGAFLRMTAQHAESLQNIAVSDSLYLYVLEELIIQTYGVDLNDAPPEIKGGLQKILEL